MVHRKGRQATLGLWQELVAYAARMSLYYVIIVHVHTLTLTHARTHARTHTHTHTRTHTHTCAHTQKAFISSESNTIRNVYIYSSISHFSSIHGLVALSTECVN